ncbi:hypothetical protein ACQ86B_28750 (plasmid) [Mycolicibacterium aichiense]|uniref:hypothetical protein n=1 Tax=Mycolicibacterium aichiense TaxID=1799 RepID=UPI003D66F83C
MSLSQSCAEAEAAISRARSLFGDPPPTSPADDAAAALRSAQRQNSDMASTPSERWTGVAQEAHGQFAMRAATTLSRHANNDSSLSGYLRDAAEATRHGASQLDAIAATTRQLSAAAVGAQTPADQRAILAGLHTQVSRAQSVVQAARERAGGLAGSIQALGYGDMPLSPRGDPPPPREDDRTRNQRDAFRKLFGRDPVSKSDWTTAASLDPHSYDPKFKGVPPEVKVVRIRPVPGQGVVRSGQFISDRDVTGFPPPSRDLGNNRGPNANFDPEDTKVTTTIDYDNGIVVLRQNPSVVQNADGSTGDVRVGSPTGSVTQTADGAVRIKYDSGNPFAPGVSRDPGGIMAGHTETVNGDLVFTPGAGGVQVGGTRTDYPWMEVYQDMPNGSSHTVLIDPAAAGGALGPSTNLPFHHDVGNGGKAFAPFDTGGWNPRYDVRVPLPATDFGPVTAPPSVPPLPPGTAQQF